VRGFPFLHTLSLDALSTENLLIQSLAIKKEVVVN